jgi:hypothetical protein
LQIFLQGLAPTDSTDYSLWKVTKKIRKTKNLPHPSGQAPDETEELILE